MLDWLIGMIPSVLGVIVTVYLSFYGWRMIKALLYGLDGDEEDGAADSARELRLTQSRIRRLRSSRYAAEHAAWSAEFSALGGGCSCHGSPAPRRSASRYVPYL